MTDVAYEEMIDALKRRVDTLPLAAPIRARLGRQGVRYVFELVHQEPKGLYRRPHKADSIGKIQQILQAIGVPPLGSMLPPEVKLRLQEEGCPITLSRKEKEELDAQAATAFQCRCS